MIDDKLKELDRKEAKRRAEEKRRTKEAAAAVAAAAAKVQSSHTLTGYANHPKLPVLAPKPADAPSRSQKKVKAAEMTIPCPICGQTPFHLVKDCPNVRTTEGIFQVLQDYTAGHLPTLDKNTAVMLKDMLEKRYAAGSSRASLGQPQASSSSAPRTNANTSLFPRDYQYPGGR